VSAVAGKKRLLLADDHPVVLRGLAELIAGEPDLVVTACCSDGNQALEQLGALEPDVGVLDLCMPAMTGLAVLRAARKARLRTRIILLTAAIDDRQLLEAVAAGVEGIVLKDTAPDDLVRCIRTVLSGSRCLPKRLVTAAIDRECARRERDELAQARLTGRERSIAVKVASGLSNKQIARELAVGEGTVKIHLHNIYRKLGLQNRSELAVLASRYRAAK
jgi:DNA-binding NarL/FixJ family response regulator